MTKRKKAPPPETVDDEFNELGSRGRNVVGESLVVYQVLESKSGDCLTFEVSGQVTIDLEDGRRLSKHFGFIFSQDEVE